MASAACPPSDEQGEAPKKKFKDYLLSYLHLNFAEVQTEEGKQYLFVGIYRTNKLAFAELHPHPTQAVAVEFLRRVLPQISYKAHKLLTDNAMQFRNLPQHAHLGHYPSGQLCDEWGIEQRFTKPAHP
jgi:transposase-like protein